MNLTPKQQEMLEYIRDYIKTNGIAPNAAEAAIHFDKSRQSCCDLMNKLNEIGAIEFNKLGIRYLRIVGDDIEPVLVNLNSPVVEKGISKNAEKVLRMSETETPEVAFKSKWLCMPLRAL